MCYHLLRILPKLRLRFPQIDFEFKDPNEEWDFPEELIVIDTVVGIRKVKVFDDINKFDTSPRVSMHDFDALANIRLLIKLGKIKKVKIIGIPPSMKKEEAISEVGEIVDFLRK